MNWGKKYFIFIGICLIAMGFGGSQLWAGLWKIEAEGPVVGDETPTTVACVRPAIEGGAKASFSPGDKQKSAIYTNVGHGGSGWSNAPGCVKVQAEDFVKRYPDKSTAVSVVGDGLVSRVWRYHLRKAGYHNISVFFDPDRAIENTASYNASGVYSPEQSSVEEQQSAQDTFAFYQELERELDIQAVVPIMHLSNRYIPWFPKEEELEIPDRQIQLLDADATVVVVEKSVTLKFYTNYLVYKAPSFNTREILRGLDGYLKKKPSWERRVPQKIEDVGDLPLKSVVIDASGVGIGNPRSSRAVGYQVFTNSGLGNVFRDGHLQDLQMGLNIRAMPSTRFPLENSQAQNDYLHLVPHGSTWTLGGSLHDLGQIAQVLGCSENLLESPEYCHLQDLKTRWRQYVWLGVSRKATEMENNIIQWGQNHFSHLPPLWVMPEDKRNVFAPGRVD